MKRFCVLDCPICRDGICTECYAPEPPQAPSDEDWSRWLGLRPARIIATGSAPNDTHAEGYGLLQRDSVIYPRYECTFVLVRACEPERHSVDPSGWLRRFHAYENSYTTTVRNAEIPY